MNKNVCLEMNGIYFLSFLHPKFKRNASIPVALYSILEIAVKEKYLEFKPDGIAVVGAQDGWFCRAQDFLMGAFTFILAELETFLVKDYAVIDSETNKIVNTAVTDEYREGLKFLNQLYKMGTIYDGNFTQTGEQLKTLVNRADEPVLFFTAGIISDCIDSASNNKLYRHYEAMAPIAGPDGTQIAWTKPNYGVSSGAMVLTDNCENVEAAFRWCDFFYSENGVDEYAPEGLDILLFNVTKELYEPYGENSKYINLNELKVTSDEKSEVSTIAVEIEKYINENQAAFITGQKDIEDDATWESYLTDVENAGLSTILGVYQTAYDRSMSEAATEATTEAAV